MQRGLQEQWDGQNFMHPVDRRRCVEEQCGLRPSTREPSQPRAAQCWKGSHLIGCYRAVGMGMQACHVS